MPHGLGTALVRPGGPSPLQHPRTGLSPGSQTELQRSLEHHKQPAILAAQELCHRSDLQFHKPQAIKLDLSNLLASVLLVSMHAAAGGGPGKLKLTELVMSTGVTSPAH